MVEGGLCVAPECNIRKVMLLHVDNGVDRIGLCGFRGGEVGNLASASGPDSEIDIRVTFLHHTPYASEHRIFVLQVVYMLTAYHQTTSG